MRKIWRQNIVGLLMLDTSFPLKTSPLQDSVKTKQLITRFKKANEVCLVVFVTVASESRHSTKIFLVIRLSGHPSLDFCCSVSSSGYFSPSYVAAFYLIP